MIARGASVAIADLDQEATTRAASQLHDTRAIGVAADVTDRGAVQRAVAETVERFGGLDVVVANAGIASRVATFRAMPTETFQHVVDVDLFGVVRTVEAALPQIVERRGHVVVVSSIYAFTNGVGAIPYAMSKAAVEQFGRALRVELVQHGASASVASSASSTPRWCTGCSTPTSSPTMLKSLPKPLRKRLQPAVAGEAIVRGIERRQPRIIRPRRWTILSVLRGVLGPLSDARLERDEQGQSMARLIDARAGEDQPTTA